MTLLGLWKCLRPNFNFYILSIWEVFEILYKPLQIFLNYFKSTIVHESKSAELHNMFSSR